MKYKTFIQFKAAFLLIIFSLNMMISFACTLNIFCYKCYHESIDLKPASCSQHKKSEAATGCKTGRCTKDCCNDIVVKFSGIEKSFPESYNSTTAAAFISLVYPFYYTDILQTYRPFTKSRYHAKSHHPPIPDIRIAIQSFQI